MPARPAHGNRVVTCLFIVLFLGVADSQILSPLLPAIRSQMGKTSAEMGYLFTGYSLCAGLSVLAWGPLSDRFGRKPGLLAGLAAFASGSGICHWALDFKTLLTGRILTGMGASMLSLNTISYAADFFPYTNRGWAMGSILSSYFAALILGVPLGSYIGDRFGWNAVFGATGLGAVALLAALAWFLPSLSSHGHIRAPEILIVQQIRTYLAFFKSQKTLGGLMSSFFASAGTMGFLAFVGIWLHDAFRVPAKQIGLLFLASGTAALVASPLAGSLSDRIGKRMQFVLSNTSLALFLLLVPNLHWGVALFTAFSAIGLSAAFRQGPMEALLTEVAAPGRRGSFIALKNSFSQLGIGLAALASGILFETSGYMAVCVFCAIINLAAAGIMILLVRDRNL